MLRDKHFILFLLTTLTALCISPSASAQYYCGDGYCDFGENCPYDCGNSNCGDSICTPEFGEDRYTCTQDCVCGDGLCSNGETSSSCSADCGPPPTCTPDTCSTCSQPAFGDYDSDAVPDRLEYDLAHKFFPSILLQTFSDDLNQTYLYRNKAIPYTVTSGPVTGICNESYKCLEIRYGTAYFNDIGAEGHAGDSELYAALVMRTTSWSGAQGDADQWQLIRDFTAAHWKAGWGSDSSRLGAYGHCSPNCRAWDDDETSCHAHAFDGEGCSWMFGWCTGGVGANYQPCSMYGDEGSCYFAGGSCRWIDSRCSPNAIVCDTSSPRATPPILYASKGKHGLYHSKWECDNGGFMGYDQCPSSSPPYDMRSYKGQLLQNVGQISSYASFDITIQYPDNCYPYDVWGGGKFGSPKTSSYRDHFTHTFNWSLTP